MICSYLITYLFGLLQKHLSTISVIKRKNDNGLMCHMDAKQMFSFSLRYLFATCFYDTQYHMYFNCFEP